MNYRMDQNGFYLPANYGTPFDGIKRLNKKRRQGWRIVADFSGSTSRHSYIFDAAFQQAKDILTSDSEAKQRIVVGATPFGTDHMVFPYQDVKEWDVLKYQAMGASNLLPALNASLTYSEMASDWMDLQGIAHNHDLILVFSDGWVPLDTLGSTVARIQQANPFGPRSVFWHNRLASLLKNVFANNKKESKVVRTQEYTYQVLCFYVVDPLASAWDQKSALKTLCQLSSDGTAAKIKASSFPDLIGWFSTRAADASKRDGNNEAIRIGDAPHVEGVENAEDVIV